MQRTVEGCTAIMDIDSKGKKRICLILPFFVCGGGKFNNYFPLFLQSCEYNHTINWLIITDSQQQYSWPSNVRVLHSSFDDFKKKVEKCFPFEISLDTPYKLCDYKPAYGEILESELEGFDFWGHCDCDLIFGDIRSFLSEDILDKYDKFFSRGHLTIYRNIPEINSFYRKQTYLPYNVVFSSRDIFAFDEWAGVSIAWYNEGRPIYDELIMDDIRVGMKGFHPTKEISNSTSPYRKYHDSNMSKAYRRMKHTCYFFDEGQLYRVWIEDNREIKKQPVLYVHFQKRKMDVKLDSISGRYMIANDTFYPAIGLSVGNLKKMTGRDFSWNNNWNNFKNSIHPLLHFVRKIVHR